jgi:hypothetical protein
MSNFTQEELTMFTHAERTEKKYSINDVVAAAKALLRPGMAMCTNSVPRCTPGESDLKRYTAVEVSRISQRIADDSFYFGGFYH